nr:T9SS type A sorting domain-containing protein [uncultured Brumimicrobium sp.]
MSLTSNEEFNVSLEVYPNVFDASLNVDADTQLINYAIYTTSGSIVQKGSLNGKSATLSTETVDAGMYILLGNTKAGSVSKRIIKQ